MPSCPMAVDDFSNQIAYFVSAGMIDVVPVNCS